MNWFLWTLALFGAIAGTVLALGHAINALRPKVKSLHFYLDTIWAAWWGTVAVLLWTVVAGWLR